MKQLEVQIMGQSYLLASPDGGASQLLEAVERVDSAMCKIRDAGKVKARERIAVLAALNLAFELAEAPSRPTTTTTDSAAVPSTPDDRWSSLIERLDAALADDGRLL